MYFSYTCRIGAFVTGFVNRRGNSQSGAYIGSGVLSASAMNPLRNVELENTLKRVYWDADGRRHDRKELLDEGSVVGELAA